MRNRPSHLERPEIGSAAGKVVIDSGKSKSFIDGSRARPKLKIEIRRTIECARIRPGRRYFYKRIVVNQDAVFILAGRIAVFLQCLESPHFSRLCLELRLLLRR